MPRNVTAVVGLLCVVLFQGLKARAFDPLEALDRYNVVWDSPSANAHGSMPLGNGDVGVNAWVEKSGDLVLYISKTDAWDENGRLCKVGRVRVKFDPPLPAAAGFRQELKLRDGVIDIRSEDANLKSHVSLWVDAQSPVVRVESDFDRPVSCRAELELWRSRERPLGPDDDSHSGGGLSAQPFKPTVLPDTVVGTVEPRIVWYHRNTRSVYPLCLENQRLQPLDGRFVDPLLNHTFGACLAGEGMGRDGDRALMSAAPANKHTLAVTVLAARTDTPEAWLAQLDGLAKRVAPSRPEHEAWWREFWTRSWIFVGGGAEADTLNRGYVLQRFMNACSGRGAAPIKFNGSIFNVEAEPGANPETPGGDPDWRRWGGNYWFQNTRLAYWPMLAAGDFEMMQPWFLMYLDALPLGKDRVQTYYKFDNAAAFPETMYFWGLPNNNDFGWGHAGPEPANPFIRRYWTGGLELIAAMLDRYDHTQDEAFARDVLTPLADPLVAFFDQYFKRDANGKIRFDPAQALETFHVAVNPMPEIAGLRFLLPRLLALPESTTTAAQRERWTRMLGELPPIPEADVGGKRLLRPAETFSQSANVENPELYAVFPYRVYGVGRPGLDMARATYAARGHRQNRGWCQDSIQAACLGLGDEAGQLVAGRAAQVNTAHRFPAMWGPNYDWVPDQDHGNNILTTLQCMLLQSDGDTLYVLPAWPKSWNVNFKLHAPKRTTVEGEFRDGKLQALEVSPGVRKADVKMIDP